MAEIEIVQENTISLAELKQKLEGIKTEKEPSFRTKKMQEYLTHFAKAKSKEGEAIKEKLQGLNILRLNERCITKLIDLRPEDSDSLRMILASENITIKQEELNKILECLK